MAGSRPRATWSIPAPRRREAEHHPLPLILFLGDILCIRAGSYPPHTTHIGWLSSVQYEYLLLLSAASTELALFREDFSSL